MARKGITFDQVVNAADAIKARGMEPTIHAVRTELGNEGSYSTISQHLARWKSESANKNETKELPPEAEDAGMQAITTMWNVAVKYASQETAAVRQEADDTKKRMAGELADATKEIERLEGVYDAACAMQDNLNKDLATLRKENAKLEGQLGALQKAYEELLAQVKQPVAKALKAVDTKSEPHAEKPNAPGKKQA